MLSDDLLIEHQKIVKQLIEGKIHLPRLEELADKLDVVINAYAEIADDHQRAMKRWNDKAKTLCEFRNVISKMLTNAKGEKNELESHQK